jgi:hypothetical protein
VLLNRQRVLHQICNIIWMSLELCRALRIPFRSRAVSANKGLSAASQEAQAKITILVLFTVRNCNGARARSTRSDQRDSCGPITASRGAREGAFAAARSVADLSAVCRKGCASLELDAGATALRALPLTCAAAGRTALSSLGPSCSARDMLACPHLNQWPKKRTSWCKQQRGYNASWLHLRRRLRPP